MTRTPKGLIIHLLDMDLNSIIDDDDHRMISVI